MDGPERALIVDEPWISTILSGDKTWEMRKTVCNIRGRVGLIRKGSGLVVGTAVLSASLPPIESLKAYAAAEAHHRIPPDRQGRAFNDGWRTPWVLEDVRRLPTPVRYEHPNGAVIWVTLQPAIMTAISQIQYAMPHLHSDRPTQGSRTGRRAVGSIAQGSAAPHPDPARHMPVPTSDARQLIVTGGNLRQKHLYLPLDFFPDDTIGGSNKAQRAARLVTVTFDPGSTVETDLDGTKRMLRARAEVGDFLARADVAEGDVVLVIRTAPYAYTIRKAAHA